jgi:TctA family transporter
MVGAFSLNNTIFDVWVTAIFGVLGYLMIRYGYSTSALTLGMILGPILERGLRQSLLMFQGDASLFLGRPIAIGLLITAAIAVVVPYVFSFLQYCRSRIGENS